MSGYKRGRLQERAVTVRGYDRERLQYEVAIEAVTMDGYKRGGLQCEVTIEGGYSTRLR